MRSLITFFGKAIMFGLISIFFALLLLGVFRATKTIKPDFRDANIEISEETEWNVYSDSAILHQRIWEDYQDREFKILYYLHPDTVSNAHTFKQNLKVKAPFWQNVYASLIHQDSLPLLTFQKALAQVIKKEKPSSMGFANAVVSFVQDIPYTLITNDDCNNPRDPLVKDYVRKGIPCSGLQPFGIMTPVEFLATLEGDCDSRTVLSFLLLSQYGYDVAILNSDFYRHSILGVNLPAIGNYLDWRGTKFYTWETTAKNMRLGELNPELNNMKHWKIILRSK